MDVAWWALVVSVLIFGVSVLTFWRNRPFKPLWVSEVRIKTDDEGTRYVTGLVVNRGRGTARDVTFQPLLPEKMMRNMSTRKAPIAEFGDELEITIGHDADAEGHGGFLLTWSEEPHLHKRRTKRLNYRIRAVPDPDSRRGRRAR